MAANEMEDLRSILLGLGLNALPQLLMNLHKARNAGRNLEGGRSHKDDGPSTAEQAQAQLGAPAGGAQDLLAMLAPLLGGQGAPGTVPMPQNTPGMRPGFPPAPLPQMGSLPRTVQAGAGPSGW